MPFAVLVLVFDGLALPRLTLLGARGLERFRMRGKYFRERAVDGVGLAVLVADHLVSDVCLGFTCLARQRTFVDKNHPSASPVLPGK